MLIDLHSHTTLSDGTLTFDELVAAAERRSYDALAITDHVRGNDPAYCDIASAVRHEVECLAAQTNMRILAGVEVTDFEPSAIPSVAKRVRRAGAQVVVVHGECLTLTVAPGTNAAAVRSPDVDILAHPGLLSPEDAIAAARNGIYVELSAIVGASYANGHICWVARRAGAPIVVNSDAHDEAGMLSRPKVAAILRGAGAPESFLHVQQSIMAPALLQKLLRREARVITGSHSRSFTTIP